MSMHVRGVALVCAMLGGFHCGGANAAHPPPSGALIPPDRVTVWQPGIPGGVPAVKTVFATIDAATYGNGTTDATAAINAAIAAAGTVATAANPQVVYLPPGTYLTSGLVVLGQSYVVLRGAGPALTRILLQAGTNQSSVICLGCYKWNYPGPWNVVGSVPKGSTALLLANADAAGIQVGDVLQIDQQDASYVTFGDGCFFKRQPTTDASGPGTGGAPFTSIASPGGPWRSVGQQVRVASKTPGPTNTVLGLAGVVHIAFDASQKPQVFKTIGNSPGDPGTWFAGVEDLNLAFSWIKNVESDGNPATGIGMVGAHVNLLHAYRCEVRDSYFHHASTITAGGGAYGINLTNQSSDNLVENNIFVFLNKPVLTSASGGGNVFGYNYVDNATTAVGPGWQENGIDGSHEAFSHFELFEGNWAVNIGTDETHGNSGWMTFFRNYASGLNSAPPVPDFENVRAAGVDGYNREHTFVGNVLGQSGWVVSGHKPVYECTSDACGTAAAVYRIGTNVNGIGGQWDDGTALRLLYRHGNWDSVSKAVVWDPSNSNHTLPSSLYLSAKPAFFGADPWPWVGPDVQPMVGTLPAKKRYDALGAAIRPAPGRR